MQPDEKLVWLGIKQNTGKSNTVAADLRHLEDTVGDWASFADLVNNQAADYDELETELTDTHGWTTGEADPFISRLENEFNSYADLQSSVDGFESYEDLQALFDTATTFVSDSLTRNQEPAAGIRLHETAGVSESGVDVPAGTAEVFGNRIEFSEQAAARGTRDPPSYANLSATNTTVGTGVPITISADVTNENGFAGEYSVVLTRDGEVEQEKTVSLSANETVTVEFEVVRNAYICSDYSIGGLDPLYLCWRSHHVGVVN